MYNHAESMAISQHLQWKATHFSALGSTEPPDLTQAWVSAPSQAVINRRTKCHRAVCSSSNSHQQQNPNRSSHHSSSQYPGMTVQQ